nr:hypothetical protein [Tanacetum cinerariifolium]
MILPSKDNLYNGQKGIGFKNPSYFEIEKDLRPTLYDEKQTSSLKPYVSNVILEKIIIDLEDEVVNLLEKEKANLKTIESLKSKGFELSENVISESEDQSENDCLVVEKECHKVENSKVIAPVMFKLNVSQCVSPISMSKSSCESNNVKNKLKRQKRKRKSSKQNVKQVDNDVSRANSDFVHLSDLNTFSSVRRPKHIGVIWKKKWSSNTSNVDLSALVRTDNGMEFKNKTLAKFFDEDVRKLKVKGDIGVFVGYSKESAAFRIYNQRTCKIHESVNVNFDEISEMASKQFNLEPDLSNLNETEKSSNPSVSKSKKDLEDLFQDFYDEESSSSSLNDDVQQSPEEVILPQTNTQSISNNMVPNGDEASTSHNMFNERLEDAYFDASTLFQPYPHEKKWTKDHPFHKIIGDPKSSVRTSGQLANSCLFSCLLSSVEPANVAEALRDADWTVHMIMPSKDNLYNGKKGIGFENPRYFEKEKDLRPTLYNEKVIGLGYTLMFLTYSDEALEIEKFKRSRENKIEFAYEYRNLNVSYVNEKINLEDDYFQEIINPDFEKIDSSFQQTSLLKPYVPNVILEKIIIDLEDEVVNLLEKEKANLETIESLK